MALPTLHGVARLTADPELKFATATPSPPSSSTNDTASPTPDSSG